MANANVFAQYVTPAMSIADYQAQGMQQAQAQEDLRARRQQNALQALTMTQQQQTMAQAQAEREAHARIASGWNATTPVQKRLDDMRNSGMPGLIEKADAWEKANLDRGKLVADTKESAAKARNQDAEAAVRQQTVALQNHAQQLQRLSGINDPAGAAAWLDNLARIDPESAQQAAQDKAMLMQNPGAFAQWKDATLKAGLTLQQQAEQLFKAQELAQREGASVRSDATTRAGQILSSETIRRGQNIARDAAAQGGSIQTDAQGNMVVVPTRAAPGQPVQASPVMSGGKPIPSAVNTPKIGAEVQRQIGGVIAFDKDLAALEEVLKTFNPRSTDQANTTARARIQSIAKQAQLNAKEAAALGALSGPDMALLEGILNDPTSIKGMMSGAKGLSAQISEARAGNVRRAYALRDQYGEKAAEPMLRALGITTGAVAPPAGAASSPGGGIKFLGFEGQQ